MTRFIGAALLAALATGLGGPARAEGDAKVTAVLDKAIKALGGEEKLAGVKAAALKLQGTITTAAGESEFTARVTTEGLDRFRQDFEGDIGGNKIHALTVLNGDKGWRKFNKEVAALDKNYLAGDKHKAYLQVIPMTLLPLKGKDFKVEMVGEDKVNGKPAVVVKVTEPGGKDFKLYFDKESGLPVKHVSIVASEIGGGPVLQEMTYGNYKDFGGVKVATKLNSKREHNDFLDAEIVEFKVLKDVDPKLFTEPAK